MLLRVLQAQNCTGVSCGQLAALKHFQDLRGQVQQPKCVGHGGPGFSHPLCRLFLGHGIILHQRLIAQGFFHRVQVLPLQVLNQGQFHGFLVVGLDDHGGDLRQVRHPCGPPAALAGDDLIIAVAALAHGQGLDNAVLPDGRCQVLQSLRVKFPPGLVRVRLNFVNGQYLVRPLGGRFRLVVQHQRPEALAKALLFCQIPSSFP